MNKVITATALAAALLSGGTASATGLYKDVELRVDDAAGNTATWAVEQVLLALPPRLAASRLDVEPPLPPNLARRWLATPTWMSQHAKYVAVYDMPFWREKGLSGGARSNVGPMGEIHDVSLPDGHAALFGVYGMLGIGLLLFCLRGLSNRLAWSDKLLAPMFWCLNIGLAMMVFLSLVPAGIYQSWASITQGMWYARSAEFVHSPIMETLVWMRVPGDVVFAIGTVFLAWFAVRLLSGGKDKPALVPAGAKRA